MLGTVTNINKVMTGAMDIDSLMSYALTLL